MAASTDATLMAARFAPWATTRKSVLAEAATTLGLTPRPNWRGPSHEELRVELEILAAGTGVTIIGRDRRDIREGPASRYQTQAAWTVAADGAAPGRITWDIDSGKIGGQIRGPQYRPFVEGLPAALDKARSEAKITRNNLHDQIALTIMDAAPAAPYSKLAHIGAGSWMVMPAGADFERFCRFMRAIGMPVRDKIFVDGPQRSMLAVLAASLESAESRFGTRSGWLAVARRSHADLRAAVMESS